MLLGRRRVHHERDRGQVAPGLCPACHRDVIFRLLETETTPRMFFADVSTRGSGDFLWDGRAWSGETRSDEPTDS